MRTLGKIKLLAISALIVLGMSSCLKNSDPDFGIGINPCFILQEGANDFKPVMRVFAYEAIQKVNVQYNPAHDSLDVKTLYLFSAVDQAKTQWWLGSSYGSDISTENIPNGTFTISASNLEGKVTSVPISVNLDKKLGELNIRKLTYTINDGISAEFDKVENATDYVLMYQFKDQKGWAFVPLSVKSSDSPITGLLNPSQLIGLFGNLEKGTTFKVTIGAVYPKPGSIPLIAIQRGHSVEITWGTDNTPSAE